MSLEHITTTTLQDADAISATASGTNTYTATITPAPTAYAAEQRFHIKFTNANTGAATINLNALGAKALTKNGATALASGDIAAGQVYIIIYDGTQFQLLGVAGTGGGGGTATYAEAYMNDNVTVTVITTINTPVKVLGTTTAGDLADFTHTSNRLTYTGTTTKKFMVEAIASINPASGLGIDYSTYIAVNGVIKASSKNRAFSSAGSQIPINSACLCELATNDYVEVWIENNDNTVNVTMTQLNMIAIIIN